MANPNIPTGQASVVGNAPWSIMPNQFTNDWVQKRNILAQKIEDLQRQYDQMRMAIESAPSTDIYNASPYTTPMQTNLDELVRQALLQDKFKELAIAQQDMALLERVLPFTGDQELVSAVNNGSWQEAADADIERRRASGQITDAQAIAEKLASEKAIGSIGQGASVFATGQPTTTPVSEPSTPVTADTTGDTFGSQQDQQFQYYTTMGFPVRAAAELAYGANIPVPIQTWIAQSEATNQQPTEWGTMLDRYNANSQDPLAQRYFGLNQESNDFNIAQQMYERYNANPQDPLALQYWGMAPQTPQAMTPYQQQSLALQQQELQAQMAYQQAVLAQQREEMKAQIGQAVANMANQSYMNTLGYRLPAGTQYAPGFGPGGIMSQMAGMSGISYTPTQIGVANPPTTDELMNTVREAINRF